MFKSNTTKSLCRTGLIAALYVLLTLVNPFSFGIFQFRISEALTILPIFFPEATIALFIGCLISNILGNGVYDVVIGSFATLIAATATYFCTKPIKNKILKLVIGGIFPVIANAIAVPIIFILCGIAERAYIVEALIIGAEEAGVVYTLGTALYFAGLKIIFKATKTSK